MSSIETAQLCVSFPPSSPSSAQSHARPDSGKSAPMPHSFHSLTTFPGSNRDFRGSHMPLLRGAPVAANRGNITRRQPVDRPATGHLLSARQLVGVFGQPQVGFGALTRTGIAAVRVKVSVVSWCSALTLGRGRAFSGMAGFPSQSKCALLLPTFFFFSLFYLFLSFSARNTELLDLMASTLRGPVKSLRCKIKLATVKPPGTCITSAGLTNCETSLSHSRLSSSSHPRPGPQRPLPVSHPVACPLRVGAQGSRPRRGATPGATQQLEACSLDAWQRRVVHHTSGSGTSPRGESRSGLPTRRPTESPEH
ncbi:uncharacterized protein J3D65DRAFT_373801 [Phyllosticta citribraziliensis]|uniref:Uncharacterized protein n=1 Tax=Phyllosticta citribraziliensis TaxID=989973 RepID=A0ABR1LQ26_9PEZI